MQFDLIVLIVDELDSSMQYVHNHYILSFNFQIGIKDITGEFKILGWKWGLLWYYKGATRSNNKNITRRNEYG